MPRPKINNALLIHTEDRLDLWKLLQTEPRIPCVKCPGDKWHIHDIYVEVEGNEILMYRVYSVCRDCLHETKLPPNKIRYERKTPSGVEVKTV